MPLQTRLDEIKEKSRSRIPPEARAVMDRAVEDVRRSGLLDRVSKAGDRAPDFTLPDMAGQPVSLRGLLDRGPAIVQFYRGRW